MVLEIQPELILHETHLAKVERHLIWYMRQLALLGEVDAARDLDNARFHSGPRLAISGHHYLNWAWKETGRWPDSSREEDKSEEAFVKLRQNYENGNWGNVPEEARRFDERGLEACLESREEERFADSRSGFNAMNKGQRLVKALDIAVRLSGNDESTTESRGEGRAKKKAKGESHQTHEIQDDEEWVKVSDLDSQSWEILNVIVSRWHANCQIEYLLESETLWPLYITGVVAEAMGVGKAELKAKAQQIVETFSQRFQTINVSSLAAGKSIRELLEIGEDNTLHGPGREYLDEAIASGREVPDPWTMFKNPATEAEIDDLEQRLDVKLPDDYKEFLRISNGFAVGSLDDGDGIFNGVIHDPALFDTAAVKWDDDYDEEEDYRFPFDPLGLGGKMEDLPEPNRVISIGYANEVSLWLVPPKLAERAREAYYERYRNGDDHLKRRIDHEIVAFAGSRVNFDQLRWCCVKWMAGEMASMYCHASFGRYLELLVADSMRNEVRWLEVMAALG